MTIPDNSILSTLSMMGSDVQTTQLGLQFASAILKQQQDQQKMIGQALVDMINQTPSPAGTGRIVDKSA
jgi:hypothetical protein